MVMRVVVGTEQKARNVVFHHLSVISADHLWILICVSSLSLSGSNKGT